MQNSKISSIGRGSNNVWWDVIQASISTTLGAAAHDTAMTPQILQFLRSKSLGRVANPNTNEGIVHLIHQMTFDSRVVATGVGEAMAALRIQINRKFNATGFIEVSTQPTDMVVYEHRQNKEADGTGLVAAGTLTANTGLPVDVVNFQKPIIMVQPFSCVCGGFVSSSVASIMIVIFNVKILVESIRVKGEEYRRLLDAYTQAPGLFERTNQ